MQTMWKIWRYPEGAWTQNSISRLFHRQFNISFVFKSQTQLPLCNMLELQQKTVKFYKSLYIQYVIVYIYSVKSFTFLHSKLEIFVVNGFYLSFNNYCSAWLLNGFTPLWRHFKKQKTIMVLHFCNPSCGQNTWNLRNQTYKMF